MKIKLYEVAEIIRTKNAGPFELTFDIIFSSRKVFEEVISKNLINHRIVAKLYSISNDQIISVIYFPQSRAIKFTIIRHTPSGDIGDRDVYGAQQHAPLLKFELELATDGTDL